MRPDQLSLGIAQRPESHPLPVFFGQGAGFRFRRPSRHRSPQSWQQTVEHLPQGFLGLLDPENLKLTPLLYNLLRRATETIAAAVDFSFLTSAYR